MEQGTNYAHDGSSKYIRNVGALVPVYTAIGVTLGWGEFTVSLSVCKRTTHRAPFYVKQNTDFSFFLSL